MQQMQHPNGAYLHNKGMSMDIGPSPYLLPPGLHGSHDSLHSLSRSIAGADDKYRPAASFMGGDNASLRSHTRGYHDDAASLAGSTKKAALGDEMNHGLLRNAQRMSRSSPPLYDHSPPSEGSMQNSGGQVHPPHDAGFQLDLPRSPSPVLIPGAPTIIEPTSNGPSRGHDAGVSTTMGEYGYANSPAMGGHQPTNLETNKLANTPPEHHSDFPLRDPSPASPALSQTTPMPPPRISLPLSDGGSDYGDNRKSKFIIPELNIDQGDGLSHEERGPAHPDIPPTLPEEPSPNANLAVDPRRNTRRMTLGLRPLPPEDPADNPEQRANRIRSFYKEYFDESKAGARETYYEDYDPEYNPDDNYTHDPVTGEYFDAVPAPFAEPINRRAMTPPPRAPPRFQGPARHMASGSMGGFSERFNAPGPRAFSSASGRLPGARGPRKPAPPPAPLQILPTPHMLKDDAIMSAIEYAPAANFRDRREGRPETPLGGLQPFSPALRAHTPLASAFDELSVIPSP